MPRFRSELRLAPLFRRGPAAAERPPSPPDSPGSGPEPQGLPDSTTAPWWAVLAPLLAVLGLLVPWAGAAAWVVEVARRRREQQIHHQQLAIALEENAELRALAQKFAGRLLEQRRLDDTDRDD